MVERMHGAVDYISLKNKSAEIVVKIPCKNHAAVNDVMGAWKSGSNFTGEYKVLLLEDHLTNWDLLVNILKDLGLKIELETISPAILPKLAELNPHLMFIDMHMPGMDEKAKIFIRYLKTSKELKHVPVVAMTTDKYHSKYQADYQSAGIEFLIRPFRVGDIVQVIKKHQQDLLVFNEKKSTKNGAKKAENLARILDSLPEPNNAMNMVIARELEELSSIPIYKGGTIINRLNRIKETHKLSEGGSPSLIGNLKSAVFEGDAERFATIIKKALSSKPS
jgi:CheY-like chemotaxis protein